MKKNTQTRRLAPIATKRLPTPAQAGAWLALAAFAFITGAALIGRDRMVPAHEEAAIVAPSDPTYLSPADHGLYSMITQAQAAGDYAKADSLITQLSNRGLVGYVLAERYLSGRYNARAEELSAWLTAYADHPHAARVAALAAAHGVKAPAIKTVEALRGDGSSDHLGRTTMPDRWFTALGAWREGRTELAAKLFVSLSANEDLNDWQQSAAHYWAYRAEKKLGNDVDAQLHLTQAAQFNTTFYGMLAVASLGRDLPAAEAPEVSDSLRRNPRAVRASLLAQLDRKDDAEQELRILYNEVSEHKRPGLVTLASELNLSNFQMRLARMPGLSPAEALFAQYPMPPYMSTLDSIMDSALLMAVARNESAFHIEARNGTSGAMGLMQMLPSTARAVERHVGDTLLSEASASEQSAGVITRLSNPALSARYGAEYLRLLTNEPAIDHSLIHLLIGYNAGPGTVASWKAASRTIDDPLLFIESIPYPETRNYVMQVLAQYWIYQSSMDENPDSLRALSKDQWPALQSKQS